MKSKVHQSINLSTKVYNSKMYLCTTVLHVFIRSLSKRLLNKPTDITWHSTMPRDAVEVTWHSTMSRDTVLISTIDGPTQVLMTSPQALNSGAESFRRRARVRTPARKIRAYRFPDLCITGAKLCSENRCNGQTHGGAKCERAVVVKGDDKRRQLQQRKNKPAPSLIRIHIENIN